MAGAIELYGYRRSAATYRVRIALVSKGFARYRHVAAVQKRDAALKPARRA